MAEQEQPEKRGYGFFRLFERGVDTATRNNVTAYGYSVGITAAFAICKSPAPIPGLRDLRLRSRGGRGLRRHRSRGLWLLSRRAGGPAQQRQVARGGTIVRSFSVGLALGVAYVVGIVIEGRWAWPVSAFSTTVVYIVAVGVELAVAHWVLRSDE